MTRTLLFSFLTIFLTLQLTVDNTYSGDQPVTLKLPEDVLIEAVKKSLPIELDTSSAPLEGSVFIKNIDNLQLERQSVSALLGLVGKNVQINTKIAGHQLRLNIGDAKLDFNISALIRFDEPSQTLFIKPSVADFNSSGNKKGSELGMLLVGLLNGQEFPVQMEKLQPIVTDLGNKQLAIELRIKDITIEKDGLLLDLTPTIKSSSFKSK